MTKWTIPADLAAAQAEADALRARVAELEAALRALLDRPHIADRDTDMEWGEVETEEAVERAERALAASREGEG